MDPDDAVGPWVHTMSLMTQQQPAPVTTPIAPGDGPRYTLRERIVLSMAVGVLAFYVGFFVAGLAHLYGRIFFVAWPIAMFLAGLVPLYKRARRVRRAFHTARAMHARRIERHADHLRSLNLGRHDQFHPIDLDVEQRRTGMGQEGDNRRSVEIARSLL